MWDENYRPGQRYGCTPDPLTDPHLVQRCRDQIQDLSAALADDTDPADVVRKVRAALTSSIIESVLQRSPRVGNDLPRNSSFTVFAVSRPWRPAQRKTSDPWCAFTCSLPSTRYGGVM